MRFWVIAFFLVVPHMVDWSLMGQSNGEASHLLPHKTNSNDSVQTRENPVDFFRELLNSATEERSIMLQHKSPAQRQRIQQGIREYNRLSREEREHRLQLLELRWHLLPLMVMPIDQRSAHLERIPQPFRAWVDTRLAHWDALPESVQSEILRHDQTLNRISNDVREGSLSSKASRSEGSTVVSMGTEEWNALSLERKREIYTKFRQFFELPEREQAQTLNLLPPPHQVKLNEWFKQLSEIPPTRRTEVLNTLETFLSAKRLTKEQFLKNLEIWAKISPEVRDLWRQTLSDQSNPPLPPLRSMPPMPPRAAQADAL